ncbi:MAG: biotin/lipoyl-binding protein [Candidatus Cloacimonetes bacterium]|nr:biotin/lipoyl-binding protein [Candidatus Cloacimonadota bacterium]
MKTYKMKINNEEYVAKIKKYKQFEIIVEVNGIDYEIELEKTERRKPEIEREEKIKPVLDAVSSKTKSPMTAQGNISAPIPGLVLRLLVNEGESVKVDDPVLILEAMKMESEITSNADGVVKRLHVKEGDSVQEGQILMEIGESKA